MNNSNRFTEEIIRARQQKNKFNDMCTKTRQEILLLKKEFEKFVEKKEEEIIKYAQENGLKVFVCEIHKYPFQFNCPICERLK